MSGKCRLIYHTWILWGRWFILLPVFDLKGIFFPSWELTNPPRRRFWVNDLPLSKVWICQFPRGYVYQCIYIYISKYIYLCTLRFSDVEYPKLPWKEIPFPDPHLLVYSRHVKFLRKKWQHVSNLRTKKKGLCVSLGGDSTQKNQIHWRLDFHEMIFWPRTFQDFHQTWGEKNEEKIFQKTKTLLKCQKGPRPMVSSNKKTLSLQTHKLYITVWIFSKGWKVS